MEVTVELPDDIAGPIADTSKLSRQLVEAFAIEGYRSRRLSRHQVSKLLKLDYWQTEDLLSRNEAKRPYTIEDLEIDRKSLASLAQK